MNSEIDIFTVGQVVVSALELSAKVLSHCTSTLLKYRLKILVEISVSTIQQNGNRKKFY